MEGHHRLNVAKEIIKTEEIYVKILDELLQFRGSEAFLPESLSVFREAHFQHLTKLKERFSHWNEWAPTLCGDILLDLGNATKFLYPLYVAYFNDLMIRVKSSTQWNDAEKSRISSNLIAPVKKMPRLLMLVKSLIKETPTDHPDARLLQKTCLCFTHICENIEAATEEAEMVRRIRAIRDQYHIDSAFVGEAPLLFEDESGSILVKEEPSFVFAFSDVLTIVGAKDRQVSKVCFLEDDCDLVAKSDDGHSFIVGDVAFQCPNVQLFQVIAEARDRWRRAEFESQSSEDVEEEDSSD